MNDHDFMPVHADYAYQHFWAHVKSGKYNQLYLEDNVIKGGILCNLSRNMHCNATFLKQDYFFTSEKGVKAFKIVKVLHEKMIEEAIRCNCPMAISTGSHLDEDYTFTRILEKLGWQRRGYVAIKHLPQAAPPIGPGWARVAQGATCAPG